MSKTKRQYVGKVGYCNNKVLGIKDKTGKTLKGGHYVYIREFSGDKCNVNVITSIEDNKGNYSHSKIEKIKKGYIYPIPYKDANFNRWSAINLNGNTKNIKLSNVKKIGIKEIKKRHRWFVGKFAKK